MSEYLIKNGFVFDPVQQIKGDKADIAVKDGKIVKSTELSSKAKTIDAKGKTVMAGAVEIHAHIAGPKVNEGRNYRPEDKLFTYTPKSGMKRMAGGFSIPTTFKTGYEYARMGTPPAWKPRCLRSMHGTCTRRSRTPPSSTRVPTRCSGTTGS